MLNARYFDGHHATAHPVTLAITRGRVRVSGDTVSRDEPLESVVISERLGRSPRFVRFADGAFCEVTDVDALGSLLAASDIGPGAVSQWEMNGRLVAALAVAIVGLLVATYVIGLPILARVVAHRIPIAAVETLSDQVLATLDNQVFEPSALAKTRQDELTTRFGQLQWPTTSEIPMRVVFRKSEALGANALALPSGVIVVTDGLVDLAQRDEEVLAVLAHEAGHVQERHGLRGIVQSSVVSLLVTWVVGDVGSLVAVAPTVLLESKYSRDLERSADDYAAATLTANGLRTAVLADILERMEASRGGPRPLSTAMGYVSSHPATEERLARLRGE